jgi:hypothetical protein
MAVEIRTTLTILPEVRSSAAITTAALAMTRSPATEEGKLSMAVAETTPSMAREGMTISTAVPTMIRSMARLVTTPLAATMAST